MLAEELAALAGTSATTASPSSRSAVVATDATGRVGSKVEDQLVATFKRLTGRKVRTFSKRFEHARRVRGRGVRARARSRGGERQRARLTCQPTALAL